MQSHTCIVHTKDSFKDNAQTPDSFTKSGLVYKEWSDRGNTRYTRPTLDVETITRVSDKHTEQLEGLRVWD